MTYYRSHLILTPSASWFRIFGWGLQLLTPHSPPLFSEREGYRTPFLILRGYRVFLLTPRR